MLCCNKAYTLSPRIIYRAKKTEEEGERRMGGREDGRVEGLEDWRIVGWEDVMLGEWLDERSGGGKEGKDN